MNGDPYFHRIRSPNKNIFVGLQVQIYREMY